LSREPSGLTLYMVATHSTAQLMPSEELNMCEIAFTAC